MLRAILQTAAAVEVTAHGTTPIATRLKLALFGNRLRTQGQRNRLQMASVRAHRHLAINIQGDGNDLCLNG